MKENNKQVVFYSAEKDGFLGKYKDRYTRETVKRQITPKI